MSGRYFDLLIYRSLSELRAEASRGYLGVIWWVLEPLLYLGVFYLVFGLGFRQGGEDYVAFLLCGLIVWKWIDSSVRTSAGTIASSVGLMGQVYLPKILLPSIIVLTNTIKFLIILTLYCVFLMINGQVFTLSVLMLPVLFLIQLLMVFSFSGIVAGLVPFVPDLRYVVNYGMTLLFFMSGIFFDLRTMPEDVQVILGWNPVVILIEAYRDVLIRGQMPDLGSLLYLTIGALLFSVGVFAFFKRYDRVFPRVVG